MKITDDKKTDLLSAQLQERYTALHNMRDRSMQFVLWVLGFGLGLAWLAISEAVFTSTQKVLITVLLVAMAAATLMFVRAIACGFKKNHDIIIRIEKAFGLHDADCYETGEPILPKQFSCSRTGWTGHFCTLYILIVTVVLMLLVVIWANPSARVGRNTEAPVAQKTAQNSPVQK